MSCCWMAWYPSSMRGQIFNRILYILPLSMAFGQHHAPPAEKPVTLLKGLGAWHHHIATKNPEAQKYFDQGLALLYGFNRYEALRSFSKATELDPAAAMAWWGIAMSLGPSINMDLDGDVDMKKSCAAVETANKLANVPAHERAWIRGPGDSAVPNTSRVRMRQPCARCAIVFPTIWILSRSTPRA